MLSFSELWEKSEKVSVGVADNKAEILDKVRDACTNYARLGDIPSPELRRILQTKKMGEILFELTKLSRLDNLNTYAALLTEVQIFEKADEPTLIAEPDLGQIGQLDSSLLHGGASL